MGSSIVRSIFIAALAAALFGLFLLVTPRLAVTDTASGLTSTTSTTAMVPSSTTIGRAPVNTSATVSTTTAVGATTTTVATTTTAAETPRAGYDGSVAITAARVGAESDVVAQGDSLTWHVLVTNTTDGELWGVFAYVEGFGKAYCEARHLPPGAATDCYATGIAYSGSFQVEAWANAWTTERQVMARVLVPLVVAA